MDGQEEVLVGGCTNDVGGEPEAPGPERSVAEKVGTGALKAYHGENEGNGQGLGSAQFEHLRVTSQLGPMRWHSRVVTTSGCALIMAMRRDR